MSIVSIKGSLHDVTRSVQQGAVSDVISNSKKKKKARNRSKRRRYTGYRLA